MHILMVSSECAPLAKAGGLGDAVAGLARALGYLGHRVEVILPAYDCLHLTDPLPQPQDRPFAVHCGGRSIAVQVLDVPLDGYRCRLLAPEPAYPLFARGRIYGEPDDAERFAFFACAVSAYVHALDEGARPDILHCHDWQSGLVPVLLKEDRRAVGAHLGTNASTAGILPIPVCYTLHNIGYQGRFPADLLNWVGLRSLPERLGHWFVDHSESELINLMQGGIAAADAVNTVSPRYAWEVIHTEQGMGLQDWLQRHAFKFAGIVNGIDTRVWDPAGDPWIPVHFDLETRARKEDNRQALCRRLGLAADPRRPVVAVVSRLDWQKGVELILHGIQYALQNDAQVVLLGAALDPQIAARFESLRAQYADSPHARLVLGYDEQLAHLIYAGADLILIPSLYEPCGLTQLIAMRYGTVPIARRVGGLADTIQDANDSIAPLEARTGYLFDEPTPDALEDALGRALWLWREHPQAFDQLKCHGMRMDWSWERPARQYLELYQYARQTQGTS
ncbi:glycogen synthase [Caldichromatium japonicum]|uniref:Glycogen synthase n=1 Tax=Caldichromatium japonicum TaxID=2699430 RepID=A0A6G7VDQ4_9GAMM|nr:glycogen synthase [Caldichromatium japonicum]QIK38151.1 glycogen synthase [Caldichromatium japonicum]